MWPYSLLFRSPSAKPFGWRWTMVWFIRYFHQSRIPNLRTFLTNIYYDFFFNWQTETKHLFWTNKKFVFFFKRRKNCGKKSWNKLVWNYLTNSLTVFHFVFGFAKAKAGTAKLLEILNRLNLFYAIRSRGYTFGVSKKKSEILLTFL